MHLGTLLVTRVVLRPSILKRVSYPDSFRTIKVLEKLSIFFPYKIKFQNTRPFFKPAKVLCFHCKRTHPYVVPRKYLLTSCASCHSDWLALPGTDQVTAASTTSMLERLITALEPEDFYEVMTFLCQANTQS